MRHTLAPNLTESLMKAALVFFGSSFFPLMKVPLEEFRSLIMREEERIKFFFREYFTERVAWFVDTSVSLRVMVVGVGVVCVLVFLDLVFLGEPCASVASASVRGRGGGGG